MHSPSDQPVATQETVSRKAGTEPIPGYRLIKPLGRGGYGDVWRCVAPGGIAKAIKFICAETDHIAAGDAPAELELAALQRFRDIRHPFLLSLDRIELVDHELVIVMELADGSLDELKAAHQDRGYPGIPRDELLVLVAEAAEALDFISNVHQLQHLDIKPQNLLVVSRHVKVADFGLVQSLQEAAGAGAGSKALQSTPVYASPETFEGRVSANSDQYSLAIVYMELLTGVRPFKGRNTRQLMLQHLTAEPDLGPLPLGDQAAIRRALAKNPADRFSSCKELVQALREQPASVVSVAPGVVEPDVHNAETPSVARLTPAELPDSGRQTEIGSDLTIDADQETPPGYEFVEYLGQNPLAEVWKAKAPDGSPCLARRLNEETPIDPAELQRLQAFRHPHVLPVETKRDSQGRWYLVSPDYETTLRDRLQACRAENLMGIPREELIGWLTGVADALDTAHSGYGILHLGLNPRRIILREDRTQVADLGLIQIFWETLAADGRHALGRYDAPEVIDGQPVAASDQYSLALLYAELVTGSHPRLGARARGGRGNDGFDLEGLTAPDRAVIRRALHAVPERRFASCKDLLAALALAHQAKVEEKPAAPTSTPVVWAAALEGNADAKSAPLPPLPELQDALLQSAAGSVMVCQGPGFRYQLYPDGHVEHRFLVQLYRGGLRLRLQGFSDQWRAPMVQVDEHTFEYTLKANRSLLQRCLGRQPGLRIRVAVQNQPGSPMHLGHVFVAGIEYSRTEVELLQTQTPLLLTSLRAFLQARPELRAEERWPWVQPVRLYPLDAQHRVGAALEGMSRDLGHHGIGLTLPKPVRTELAYIALSGPGPLSECALLAHIVRCRPNGSGAFEVGARLAGGGDAKEVG